MTVLLVFLTSHMTHNSLGHMFCNIYYTMLYKGQKEHLVTACSQDANAKSVSHLLLNFVLNFADMVKNVNYKLIEASDIRSETHT